MGQSIQDSTDEVCIYNWQSNHFLKLERVLARYEEFGGQLNPKKFFLSQPRVKILSHVIFKNKIKANLERQSGDAYATTLSTGHKTTKYLYSKG